MVLAPHAKTTMSPELVARQLAHGAWGMTVANPVQAVTLWSWGVERVLIANEVTDVPVAHGAPARARFLVLVLWFYVDSERGRQPPAVEAVRAAGIGSADVLVELGHAEGRTGVRTVEGAASPRCGGRGDF